MKQNKDKGKDDEQMNMIEKVADIVAEKLGENKRKSKLFNGNQKNEEELAEEFAQALEREDHNELVRIHEKVKELQEARRKGKTEQSELEEFKHQAEREEAIKKVNNFCAEVKPKHQARADEAMKQIKEAKEKYIESLKGLNELNLDYYKAKEPYMKLMWKYQMKMEEVLPESYSAVRANYIVPHPRTLQIGENDINKEIRRLE